MSLSASLTNRIVAFRNPTTIIPASDSTGYAALGLRSLIVTPFYALSLATAAIESLVSLLLLILTSPSALARQFFGRHLSSSTFTIFRNILSLLFYHYSRQIVPSNEAFARNEFSCFRTQTSEAQINKILFNQYISSRFFPDERVVARDPSVDPQYSPLYRNHHMILQLFENFLVNDNNQIDLDCFGNTYVGMSADLAIAAQRRERCATYLFCKFHFKMLSLAPGDPRLKTWSTGPILSSPQIDNYSPEVERLRSLYSTAFDDVVGHHPTAFNSFDHYEAERTQLEGFRTAIAAERFTPLGSLIWAFCQLINPSA